LSSWNLFSTLLDLQEMDAAVDVFNKDLTWLLQAEPNRLAAVQTKIRQNLMEMLNQKIMRDDPRRERTMAPKLKIPGIPSDTSARLTNLRKRPFPSLSPSRCRRLWT